MSSMTKHKLGLIFTASLALITTFGVRPARAAFLINSNFEPGDTTAWQIAYQAGSTGSFSPLTFPTTTFAPFTGTTAFLSGTPTVGASGGLFYALSDQSALPGAAAALYVVFSTPGP